MECFLLKYFLNQPPVQLPNKLTNYMEQSNPSGTNITLSWLRNSPTFEEPQSSLPRSYKRITDSYRLPYESSAHHQTPNPFSLRAILILPALQRTGLASTVLSSDLQNAFIISSYTLYMPRPLTLLDMLFLKNI